MLWVCRKCGTKFAVGSPYCPQCTSTNAVEDGTPEAEEIMAKITVAGGPSDVTVPEPESVVEGPSEQGEGEVEPAANVTADSGSVELPRVNDPKSAWVDYAVAQGWTGDPDEVTKAYLVETYGE